LIFGILYGVLQRRSPIKSLCGIPVASASGSLPITFSEKIGAQKTHRIYLCKKVPIEFPDEQVNGKPEGVSFISEDTGGDTVLTQQKVKLSRTSAENRLTRNQIDEPSSAYMTYIMYDVSITHNKYNLNILTEHL
jgi:hypothetical protein